MDINITKFFNEACPKDYSASVAEIGQDAGKSTWQAAMDDFDGYTILDSQDKIDSFKAYIVGFGAWDSEEIEGMNNQALNALCIQMISGDIREAGLDTQNPDWEEYQADSEAGKVSGSIFKGDDGEVYYSIEG